MDLGYTIRGITIERQRLYEESLALCREIGDKRGIAFSLRFLGNMALDQGEYNRASGLFEESLALSREVGDESGIPGSLSLLGLVSWYQGDYGRATGLYKEYLVLFRETLDKGNIAGVLEGLAMVAGALEQLRRAAGLFGAAEALRETISVPIPPSDRDEYDRNVASVRAELEKEAFGAAWEEGRKMSMEEAISFALEEGEKDD